MDNRPIGMFDSGIGGLTVLKEVMKYLPHESVIYFGDTARIPYGTKSRETITRYVLQDIRFLVTQDVKMIVIACGTGSSVAFEAAEKTLAIPLVSVIQPGAAAAVTRTKTKKIGIIGTAATIRSRAWEESIKKLDPKIGTISSPCPLFVQMAEEGWVDNEIAHMVTREYMAPFLGTGIDTLVLGCTHYPLFRNMIQKVLGEDVALINPGEETAVWVKRILEEESMESDSSDPSHRYFVSDNEAGFKSMAKRFLNRETGVVTQIDIEKY